MDVDRCADRCPIPQVLRIVKQGIEAPVAAGTANRLRRTPPGVVNRVTLVGKVLREEHILELEEVLGADRPALHRLIRHPPEDLIETRRRLPPGHSGRRYDHALYI